MPLKDQFVAGAPIQATRELLKETKQLHKTVRRPGVLNWISAVASVIAALCALVSVMVLFGWIPF